jgi:hypothetical protein
MRVALYAHVSTGRQQRTQTIEHQVAQLRSYVAPSRGGALARSTSSATTVTAASRWTAPASTRCATTQRGQPYEELVTQIRGRSPSTSGP